MDRVKRLNDAAMKLRQFGRLQIGRLVGSVLTTEGRYKAWIDLLERCYFMRAEINALSKILLDKKIVTAEELQDRFGDEYEYYVSVLEKDWPEVKVETTGFTIVDTQAFSKRVNSEKWPP